MRSPSNAGQSEIFPFPSVMRAALPFNKPAIFPWITARPKEGEEEGGCRSVFRTSVLVWVRLAVSRGEVREEGHRGNKVERRGEAGEVGRAERAELPRVSRD